MAISPDRRTGSRAPRAHVRRRGRSRPLERGAARRRRAWAQPCRSRGASPRCSALPRRDGALNPRDRARARLADGPASPLRRRARAARGAGRADGRARRTALAPTCADAKTASVASPREPLGLVLVIAPWNYPFLTAANTIVPALIAGNAVMLKHSRADPRSPASGSPRRSTRRACPRACSPTCSSATTQTRASARRAAWSITPPSPARSKAAARSSGRRRAASPALDLELGGKDPAYVRADADVAAAVENLVDGAFFNSGQSCCGVERIYVHETVWEPFRRGLRRS